MFRAFVLWLAVAIPLDAALGGNAYTRWAVLATPDCRASGVADAIEASLAKLPGLQLIERDQLEAAFRELSIASLADAPGVGPRIRLGELVHADALLTINQQDDRGNQVIRVIIGECANGTRLSQQYFPADAAALATIPQAVRDATKSVIDQYRDGVAHIVGITPFVSQGLSYAHNHLQGGLAEVLRSAVLTNPGTAVLEVEELEALQREFAIGAPRAGRPAPVFVQGEFRATDADGATRLALTLNRTGAGREETTQREFATVDEAVRFLRSEYAPKLVSAAKSAGAALSVENQVELLTKQADMFLSVGQFRRCIRLREAALLLRPEDREAQRRLISDLVFAVPFRDPVNWSRLKPGEAREGIALRLQLWRRALWLTEDLVRNTPVPPADAERLLNQVQYAMPTLDLHPRSHTRMVLEQAEAGLPKFVETELRDCKVAMRDCYRGLVALMRKREGMKPSPSNPEQTTVSVIEQHPLAGLPVWVRFLLTNPVIGDESSDSMTTGSPASLDFIIQLLTETLRDESFYINFAIGAISGPWQRPDLRYGYSRADVQTAVEKLELAGGTAALHGRFGRILLEALPAGAKQPTDITATKSLFDAWAADVEKKCGSQAGKQAAAQVEVLMKIWQPPPNPLAEAPKTEIAQQSPPERDESDPNNISERWRRETKIVPHAPVAVRVRTRDTGETPFAAEDGRSWMDEWSLPRGVFAADTFDVIWNGCTILYQREPGVWDEVYAKRCDGHAGNHDVIFDGEYVWAITCCRGVRVLDRSGRERAFRACDGELPESHAGAKLAAIAPGRVLCVGSFGADKRAWCGVLTFEEPQIKVDLIHEATKVITDAKAQRLDVTSAKAVFVPTAIHRDPKSAKDDRRFFVEREVRLPGNQHWETSFQPPMLLIRPAAREVGVIDYQLWHNGCGNGTSGLVVLPDASCLLFQRDAVCRFDRPGCDFPEILVNSQDLKFECDPIAAPGEYHIIGRELWLKWLVNEQKLAPVGRLPAGIAEIRQQFGYTKHLGFISWSHTGRVTRYLGGAGDDAAAGKFVELRKAVESRKDDWTAWRELVWALYQAEQFEAASAATLDWIRAMPRNPQARWALHDVRRRIEAGLTLREHGSAKLKGPFRSFAHWRMYNNPWEESEARYNVHHAIRLPIALDETEWWMAEMGLVHCANDAVAVNRNRPAIDVCDVWEREAKARGAGSDCSYFLLRGISRLRDGDYAGAEIDAKAALNCEKEGRAWIVGAEQLLRDIADKNEKAELEQQIFELLEWYPR